MIDLPDLYVTSGVRASLTRLAISARPLETGGLLLGWREGPRVCVLDALEVPSAHRARTSFGLNPNDVDEALNRYLARVQDARMGYVGSWHSHPALAPPSLMDRVTYRLASLGNPAPLAYLVVATDGHTVTTYPTVVQPRDGCRTVNLRPFNEIAVKRGRE